MIVTRSCGTYVLFYLKDNNGDTYRRHKIKVCYSTNRTSTLQDAFICFALQSFQLVRNNLLNNSAATNCIEWIDSLLFNDPADSTIIYSPSDLITKRIIKRGINVFTQNVQLKSPPEALMPTERTSPPDKTEEQKSEVSPHTAIPAAVMSDVLPISDGDAVLPVPSMSNSDELYDDDTVIPDAIQSNGDVCYDEDTDTD